ncbi:hypothetical protein SAMN05216276_11223 [Streptosporangium subroseum]|uniref:Uncharacterized protein n=1 Tax=Streptosporangium subroseum TaxID=106412 RepID=A0A239PC61_9ACTN|nr:hypothetical protein [Streptosporangium subroseum]SNT64543.1 hypothetical protein SAMN05216276_11223 [Streptosporangium subroseum]
MPYIEERVSTVETGIAEIKSDVAAIKAGQSSTELNLHHMAQDISELKAGQIEIRDLLARVVARLEGVNS